MNEGLDTGGMASAPRDLPPRTTIHIKPTAYRRVHGAHLRGSFAKTVLCGPRHRKYLFKPDGDNTIEMMDGHTAIAFAALAALAGVDTPTIRRVKFRGEKGTLQEWRNAPAGDEFAPAATFPQDVSTDPRFVQSFRRLDVLDAIANTDDRNVNNFLVDRNDHHVIAVDNDLTFDLSPPMFHTQLDADQQALVSDLHDRSHFASVMRRYLLPSELQAATARLDALYADISPA